MPANRRAFLERVAAVGLAAALAEAPLARAEPDLLDGTLQAFADTILPGRRATRTDLGNEIHPAAILGVDHRPGAVEADALALFHHPLIGFDALQGAFLADLTVMAGGSFLDLDWDGRVAACKAGLSFDNPARLVWEAAAAIPFTAFCAATLIGQQDAKHASGYRVMGLPGVAPHGYRRPSYGRKLARERTKRGSLG